MPFTIFGPGVQDSMSSRQLFPNRSVEKAEAVAPFPRIHGSEEEDGEEPGSRGGHHTLEDDNSHTSAGQRAVAAYAEVESPVQPEPVHCAADIMTAPVVTLNRTAPLEAASHMFREHRFRHIPILGEQGLLVGMLSERDLLRHAASQSQSQRPVGTVEGLMTNRVITTTPETRIRDMARVMYEHHLGALPVVNEHGMVRGIVTRGDILHTLIHKAPMELWA